MMNDAKEILSRLTAEGIDLYVEEGRLKATARAGSMHEGIRSLISEHKHALIAFLSVHGDVGADTAMRITPVERGDAPLAPSFAQQRLWFIDQFGGGSSQYNMPLAYRVEGGFDPALAERVLDIIVRRHESLRTVFVNEDGALRQIVRPATPFRMARLDLSHLSGDEQDQAVRAAMREDAARPFLLNSDLMLRACHIHLAPERGIMLFCMHHIASDGWSMGVLADEFGSLYGALAQGRADPLPPLRVQYADYAQWQRQWLAGATLERQLAYWETQLADLPAVHSLPLDRPRPAQQTFRGGRHEFHVGSATHSALRALARDQGATMFMVIDAAFSVLLARHANRDDVVIGTPTANRWQKELEGLIGFFVNTLVLRVDCSGNPGFDVLLQRVREVATQAQANQDVPFEYLVERLKAPRSAQYSPLFQIMISMGAERRAGAGANGGFTPLRSDEVTAKFDLTLHVSEGPSGIDLCLEYNADLFDAHTIARTAERLGRLLDGIAAAPATPIQQLPMLSDTERTDLVVRMNATQVPYARDRHVHQLFEAQAAQTPHSVAVAAQEGSITYAELNRMANQLAHRLRAAGVKTGDVVAICMERSSALVSAVLGILKAGAAYLPMDPSNPVERLAFVVQDSGAAMIVTHAAVAAHARAAVQQAGGAPLIVLDDPAEIALQQALPADNLPARENAAGALLYVVYTSGSTGKPKGVQIGQGGFLSLMAWYAGQVMDAASDNRFLLLSNFSFDLTQKTLLTPLCYGATVVIAPAGGFDAERLAAFIRDQQVSLINGAPAVFYALLEGGSCSALAGVRHVVLGGEPISYARLASWHLQSGARLLNTYGPTECTDVATWHLVAPDHDPDSSVPMGRPLPNVRLYILNEQQVLLPHGTVGELYIGGDGVGIGYCRRDELTARAFFPDPFAGTPGARMYRTGDLVRYLANGDLEFLGRIDTQVKLRGYRIELEEIERHIARVPGVQAVAVLAREDLPGERRLVAYVTPAGGSGHQEGLELARTVQDHLQTSLPDYMIPAAVMVLAALPLTSNGKVDRRALPAPDAADVQGRYMAPAAGAEQVLAGIWEQLLRLPSGSVGRDANFFALGGHSLMVVQMVASLRKLGWGVAVQAVFGAPTVAALAPLLQRVDTAVPAFVVPPNRIPADCERVSADMLPLVTLTAEEIEQIAAQVPGGHCNIQDIYPLVPLQEGILFHHLASQDKDPYLLPMLLAVPDGAAADAFLAALRHVIARHDVLRTGVFTDGLPAPLQVVMRRVELPVKRLTLDPAADGEAAMRALFDTPPRLRMTQAPLLQAWIGEGAGPSYVLLWLHHIITDHIGMEIIQAEIMDYLAGRSGGNTATPYRNFVAHTLALAERSDPAAYFRQMLGDMTAPTLPFGLDNTRSAAATSRQAKRRLAPGVAQAVRAAARQRSATPAALFHAAWALVVGACSGQRDVVFGTVLSGRMQDTPGGERIFGLCINTLPLRVRIDGPVGEFMDQVERGLLGLLQHEQAPLAVAQQCSGVPHGLPLFSAILNYRHAAGAGERHAEAGAAELPRLALLASNEYSNYPFDMSVTDQGEDFHLSAQVDASVDAERILGYLEQAAGALADALLALPDLAAPDIQVLPREEREQLLQRWNDTAAAVPSRCLHELFEEQAARTPQAPALLCGHEYLSYQELNGRANRLAGYLRHQGVQAGSLVGLCMERSVDLMVGLLAILKTGAAYLPLDPAYPKERLDLMLEDAAPSHVLVRRSSGHPIASPHVQVCSLEELTISLLSYGSDNLAVAVDPAAPAYVIYTSGSTGEPKGVLVQHNNVVNHLAGYVQTTALAQHDRVLQFSSINFDASVEEIFPPLSVGAAVVLYPSALREASEDFHDLLQRYQITVLGLPTAFWHEWTYRLEHADEAIPAAVRLVIVGGEKARTDRYNAWVRKVGARHIRWINTYGPTETTVSVTGFEGGGPLPDDAALPIGRPIANTRIYLLNERRHPVPLGATGEIHIAGAGVACGYLNRPDLTAERFLADPFSDLDGARMYRTGDLGRYRADGQIEYVGRTDSQIKLRGYRIEPGEIENCLLRSGKLSAAVVAARDDAPGGTALVAYVAPGERLDRVAAEALRMELNSWLRSQLPAFMVPAFCVVLERLPLLPNGKIDAGSLPVPFGGQKLAHKERAYTPTETVLAEIWRKVLGVAYAGPNDSFFELGGHSLLAMRAVVEIRKRFGQNIPLSQFFEQPTIASIGAILEANGGEAVIEQIEQIEQEDDEPSDHRGLLYSMIANRAAQLDPAGVQRILVLYDVEKPFIGDTCKHISRLKLLRWQYPNAEISINSLDRKHFGMVDAVMSSNPLVSSYTNLPWDKVAVETYDLILCGTHPGVLADFLFDKFGTEIKAGSFRPAVLTLPFQIGFGHGDRAAFREMDLNVANYAYVPSEQELRSMNANELYVSDSEREWADRWLAEAGLLPHQDLIVFLDNSSTPSKMIGIIHYFEVLKVYLSKPNVKALIFDERRLGKREFYREWLGAELFKKIIMVEGRSLRDSVVLIGHLRVKFVFGPSTGLLHCASGVVNIALQQKLLDKPPVMVAYLGGGVTAKHDEHAWWDDSYVDAILPIRNDASQLELKSLKEIDLAGVLESRRLLAPADMTAQSILAYLRKKFESAAMPVQAGG